MRTIESNYSFEYLTNDKPVSTSHDKSSFAYYQNREDGNGKQRSWAYAGDYYAIVSVDGYKDNFAPSEENKFTLTSIRMVHPSMVRTGKCPPRTGRNLRIQHPALMLAPTVMVEVMRRTLTLPRTIPRVKATVTTGRMRSSTSLVQ